jgi:hypothetical protein
MNPSASSGEAARGARDHDEMDAVTCKERSKERVHSSTSASPADETVSVERVWSFDEDASDVGSGGPNKIASLRAQCVSQNDSGEDVSFVASEKVSLSSVSREEGNLDPRIPFPGGRARVHPACGDPASVLAMNVLLGERALAMLEKASTRAPPAGTATTVDEPSFEEELAMLAEAQAQARRRHGVR